MSTYIVECTCGHDLQVEAPVRESAVQQMKKMMDEKGIEDHYAKYHLGERIPPVEEVHAHIEHDIKEAVTV